MIYRPVTAIEVLRDDRFDPAADTISRLSLLNPDRPEQFVDVAGLDLGDGEFSDGESLGALPRGNALPSRALA